MSMIKPDRPEKLDLIMRELVDSRAVGFTLNDPDTLYQLFFRLLRAAPCRPPPLAWYVVRVMEADPGLYC